MNNNVPIDCPICQKHRGERPLAGGIIFENDLILISHAQLFGDEKDHYLGHLFIETKRHVAGLAHLSEEEAAAIGIHTSRMAGALLHTLEMEHVYSFVIGDGAPHFHVHVIGRYVGAPREYWGSKVDDWPGAPRGREPEMQKVCDEIRKFIGENDSLS